MNTATVVGGTVPYYFVPASVSAYFDFNSNDTVVGGAGPATFLLDGVTGARENSRIGPRRAVSLPIVYKASEI
jgi:hypothetical protein